MNSEAPFGRRMGPGVRPGRIAPPPASSRQPLTLEVSESASWDGDESIASFTSSVATAPTVNTWSSRDPRQPDGFPPGVPAGEARRDVPPAPFSRIEEEGGALPAGTGGLGHGRHKRIREAIAAQRRAAAASRGGDDESAEVDDHAAGRRWDDHPPDAAQQQQVQQQQVQQQQQQVHQQQQQHPQRHESAPYPPTFQEQESPPPPSPPSPQEALPTGGPFARPDIQLSIAEPQRQNMRSSSRHSSASAGSASVSSRHSSPGGVSNQGSFDGSETSSHMRNLPPLQRQIMMASYRHNRSKSQSDAPPQASA
eukprot:CAMPEP_0194300386 /NCGR_PEP_ID=MMETSP0169-20130528/61226_1 /TAXON_ID=218684 /ORGANISM="Corethron pennatum, Strain L29A3" /LENGTH=309 /DNA_ID=CAMNT_0039050543 /DNA_START=124 /DNA_END=1051 /DNA_ORIENTATION=+